jgi:hypothetical protein
VFVRIFAFGKSDLASGKELGQAGCETDGLSFSWLRDGGSRRVFIGFWK